MTSPTPSTAPDHLSPASSADFSGSVAEALVVIVADGNGRFHPAPGAVGCTGGGLVGRVTGGKRSAEIHCPPHATVQGFLTLPGQLVSRGQALAWALATSAVPAV